MHLFSHSLYSLALSGLLFAGQISGTIHENIVVNEAPTPTLLSLLNFLRVNHDGTMSGITAATQKQQPEGFLRANGKERWQLDQFYNPDQQKTIKEYANTLGMIDTIDPQKKTYDYAIILGATLRRVRSRLAHLISLWNLGVRYKQIVFLAGDRPLDKDLESVAELFNKENGIISCKHDWQPPLAAPTTEKQMMALVMDQSALPADLANIPMSIISAPMHTDGRRPSTIDTIRSWFATSPDPGSIIAFSNQPYCSYQDAVFRPQLPDSFSLETVGLQDRKGSNTESDTSAEILLDTIARWIYNLNGFKK